MVWNVIPGVAVAAGAIIFLRHLKPAGSREVSGKKVLPVRELVYGLGQLVENKGLIFISASSASPLLGGLIADRFGLQATFYFIALTIVVANLMVFFIPEKTESLGNHSVSG